MGGGEDSDATESCIIPLSPAGELGALSLAHSAGMALHLSVPVNGQARRAGEQRLKQASKAGREEVFASCN